MFRDAEEWWSVDHSSASSVELRPQGVVNELDGRLRIQGI